MTVQEAYLIVREEKPNIDNGTEYEKGFIFGCTDDDNFIGGIGHSPMAVLKENGKIISISSFIASGSGDEIANFTISKAGEIEIK